MTQPSSIHTLAVIGAGQMGRGIAQVAAMAGIKVLLGDISVQAATVGHAKLAADLERLVSKGKLTTAQAEGILAKVVPAENFKAMGAAQIAIEAATENENAKKAIFVQLDAALPKDAILATNTSSISITRLASATQRADRVIGMHFMNPVPVMKLAEVIRGTSTSDTTYTTTCALAAQLGKHVVTSLDYPGFIVNRILMPMINEATFALMEGVASAKDIDAAMQMGTNQPMGPLTLADFIGLDTCLAILEVMHRDLGDPKYRPCPLLRRLVESGRHGRKTKHGFHKYD